MFRILLIDSTDRLKRMTVDFWRGTGYEVELVVASTMQAAIDITTRTLPYWYIDINGDSVDYIPQLAVLRSCTVVPLFALTSNFNKEEEIDAYAGGLDIYTTWEIGFVQQTPDSIIAYMNRFEKRPPIKERDLPRTLAYRDIVLSCDLHTCIISGMSIPVTKTEFDILYYLMLNRGFILSPRQIYYFVWGEDAYDETLPDSLRAHMKRLRRKIDSSVPSAHYIENVRGIGYRFVS